MTTSVKVVGFFEWMKQLKLQKNMKKIQLGGKRKNRYGIKRIQGFALVDDEDYEYLNQFNWYLKNNGYATRRIGKRTGNNGKQKLVYMHREILNFPKTGVTDHINGNRLDNRRKNLRVCSITENCRNKRTLSKRNKSGVTGVYWAKEIKRWIAQIRHDEETLYLGCFKNKQKAVETRKQAEFFYWG